MKFYNRKLTIALASLVAIYAAVFLLYILAQEVPFRSAQNTLSRIEFSGTYQEGPNGTPFPLSNGAAPSVASGKPLILRGHFNENIQSGQNLLLRAQNISINLYINDELAFSYGQPGTFPSFSKSPGNTWCIFTAPAISTEDDIRIELRSAYRNNVPTAYRDFYTQIISGDSGILFHHLIQKVGLTVILGLIVFLLGCLLILAALVLKASKTPVPAKLYYFSLFAITSGLWFLFDFQIISLVIPLGVFGNILSMLCLCLSIPLFNLYVLQFTKTNAGISLLVLTYVQFGFTLFYLFAQWMGFYDGYDLLTPLVYLIAASFILVFCVLLYETIRVKNRDTLFLLLVSGALLLICIDIKDYLVHFAPQYFMTKFSFFLFIAIHFLYMIYCIRQSFNGLARAQQLEHELAESRIAIAISQIQPHFLYNALTAIKQLCAVDPPRAELAVGEFSSFLRGNLDSLTSHVPIPFSRELNHVKNYLALEQLRFGSRLKVQYDIQADDFLLPALTVQPLVENAVRYGVTKKPKGGTVSITTREEATGVVITVSDDGVGFDMHAEPESDRAHIGIENVHNRLTAQAKGSLLIESTPGHGTTITIYLKKGAWSK